MFNNKKKFFSVIVLVIILLGIWQCKNISYFSQQARGGLNVAFNTRSLNNVLTDPTIPDSLKKRILFIGNIRKYAIDSLGLQDNKEVYQTLYDQKGRPLVYLLTVAEAYQLKGISFHFPIIGNFAYKGFFDSTMIHQEELEWKLKGYDTDIGEGIAYSTLGWLPEPILSNMLYYSDGKLASLIIHEMVHGTIFIKNDHETSENLANFIGDYGAKRFLAYKHGLDSKEYKRFVQAKLIRKELIRHLNRGSLKLDSLYRSFSQNLSSKDKDSAKYALIEQIVLRKDTVLAKFLIDTISKKRNSINKKDLPNNAYFIGFKTYNSKQNAFERLFEDTYQGNFQSFLVGMKSKFNKGK